jgi:hypothetical protein
MRYGERAGSNPPDSTYPIIRLFIAAMIVG